jgi:ribosomal protein S24E
MDLAVKNKQENKSLGRTTLTCAVSYDKAMPSRKEMREAICAAVGADAPQLVIVSAKGSFGANEAIVIAHLYKDKAAMAVANKHLLVRDGLLEKVKKAAAAKKAPAKK